MSETSADIRVWKEVFKVLAETVPAQIFTFDPDGTIDYFNRRWFEYTGLTREQSIDAALRRSVSHPEDLEKALAKLEEALSKGEPFQCKFRLRNVASADYRWHLEQVLPVRDLDGHLIKWICIMTDIHDEIE
jgi:PAS domain S-box-containing protein